MRAVALPGLTVLARSALMLWLAFMASLACMLPVRAAADVTGTAGAPLGLTNADVITEWASQEFEINADGGFVALIDHRERVLTADAARVRATHRLSYFQTRGRSVDRLEIVDAYTQKPNGTTLRLPGLAQGGTRVPLAAGLPSGALVFPDVQAGDLLVLRYKVFRTGGVFQGQFEDFVLPPAEAVKAMRVRYKVPNKFTLQSDAPGWQAAAVRQQGDYRIHEWNFQGPGRPRAEQGAVALSDFGNQLSVSTFAGWKDMARAYAASIESAAEVAPQIAAIVSQVTTGLTEPRRKALALAEWVRANIRYVALPVTVASATPDKLALILANRYTECKGHVALLHALLQAADIDSTPALLNVGDAYALGQVATLGALNHVVNYLPTLDLFIDTTAKESSGSYLPDTILGKSALLVKSGVFKSTPTSQEGAVSSSTKWGFMGDEGLALQHEVVFSGALAEPSRRSIKGLPEAEMRKAVTSMLQAQSADVKELVQVAVDTLDGSSATGAAFGLKLRALLEPDAERTRTWVALRTGSFKGILGPVQHWLTEPTRSQPFVCPAISIKETLELKLGRKGSAQSIPQNVDVSAVGYRYRATYTVSENQVRVERSLESQRSGRVCTPEDYRVLKPMLLAIQRDQRSILVLPLVATP